MFDFNEKHKLKIFGIYEGYCFESYGCLQDS